MFMKSLSASLAAALYLTAAPFAYSQERASEAASAQQTDADAALQMLYGEYHDWRMTEWGFTKSEDGDYTRGGTLPSVKPAEMRRRAAAATDFLARLNQIGHASLSPEEQVNAAVLRSVLTEQIGDARFAEWEMPFDSDSNFWSYLNPRTGFQSVEEYDAYIARMRQVPRYFEEQIANSKAGLARGFSVPRVTLEGRDASLVPYAAEDYSQNPFWSAFEQMPDRFAEEDRKRLKEAGRAAIEQAIAPSYANLLKFLRDDYFPNARGTIAAEKFPDGEAYYAQQIRQYTTLDLTADQIHAIGLDEVARIEAAMRAIMQELAFEGSISEFNERLRTDPQFIARTPEELMGVSAYVAKRVDGKLGEYFGFLPRHRFTIRPVPDAIAPFYTAGRGGYESCLMNTHDLSSRPLYNIPALTIHECAPGHSFQAAFQREQGETAEFRRSIYFSGMGEGWGLYTEFLGEEMGIYRTPYERFGRLSYEMWRAARLVIDTGIHSQGWSRDQAVEYLADRTALSRHEVGTEIDRYISWPGQALAYKLGEMQIRRLRGEAEAALGDDFDIRKFHDVILAMGSVPLPVLESRIGGFIADGGKGLEGVDY
ncbi:DUF885 family protein [Pontixanthobacter luteolus]